MNKSVISYDFDELNQRQYLQQYLATIFGNTVQKNPATKLSTARCGRPQQTKIIPTVNNRTETQRGSRQNSILMKYCLTMV